jgi:hypothetical protein
VKEQDCVRHGEMKQMEGLRLYHFLKWMAFCCSEKGPSREQTGEGWGKSDLCLRLSSYVFICIV